VAKGHLVELLVLAGFILCHVHLDARREAVRSCQASCGARDREGSSANIATLLSHRALPFAASLAKPDERGMAISLSWAAPARHLDPVARLGLRLLRAGTILPGRSPPSGLSPSFPLCRRWLAMWHRFSVIGGAVVFLVGSMRHLELLAGFPLTQGDHTRCAADRALFPAGCALYLFRRSPLKTPGAFNGCVVDRHQCHPDPAGRRDCDLFRWPLLT
jgi:hypothetical protein